MPDINDVKALIADIGKASLHALMPNDFEYYVVALELTDLDDNTIDYLLFPVTPAAIDIIDPELTNIKKSAGGVVAISTPTFVPKPITLSGTFGRKLRLLLSASLGLTSFSAIKLSTSSGLYKKSSAKGVGIRSAQFDAAIKTGYGVTKVLQSICDKSTMLDDKNLPLRLYFYNPTFGESYLVKKNEVKFSQEKGQSNMLWQYNLKLTAIAPLDQIRSESRGNLATLLTMNVLQKEVNNLAQEAVSVIRDAT